MSQVAGQTRQTWKVMRPNLKRAWGAWGTDRKYSDWLAFSYESCHASDFQWFKTWEEAYAYAYVQAYGTPEARRHMLNFFLDGGKSLSPTYVRRLGVGNV